jgi:hypothetical protein
MRFNLKIWTVALMLMLAAFVALSTLVLRESIFQDIQKRSGISKNLWLINLDTSSESFPWVSFSLSVQKYNLAVGFPYYQKTIRGGLPQPQIQPMNRAWVEQVMPLRQGRLPKNSREMLAVENGAYKLGEQVVDYSIVGLISAAPWRSVSDATLFQITTLKSDYPPVPPTMIIIQATNRQTAEQQALSILGSTAIGYRLEPALDAVLAQGFKDVELSSLNTVSQISVFLLFLAIIGLCDALAAMWAVKRETWRTERALGRPARVLAFRCLLESLGYWLPSLIIAGIGACLIANSLNVPAFMFQVLVMDAGFIAIAFVMLSTFTWQIANFPLALVNLSAQRTWKTAFVPFVSTTLIVATGTLLLSDALQRHTFANERIQALGANRIDIRPDYTAKNPFTQKQCEIIVDVVTSCFVFGVVNAPPMVKGTSIPDWNRVTLMDARAAQIAQLELIAGRWLNSDLGVQEIVLTETAYQQVQTLGVKINERLDNHFPFVLVGVVKDYKGRDSPDFVNPVFASPNDPFFMRFPKVAPIGTNGMVLTIDQLLESSVRVIRERLGSRITVVRPASMMLDFRAKAERDLQRISILICIAAFICLQVFASFVANLIMQIGTEIAIWRVLGMDSTRIVHQLLRLSIAPVVFGGVVATIIVFTGLGFSWFTGSFWLISILLFYVVLFLVIISSSVAFYIVYHWTRLSPQALLLRLEST